MNKIRSLIEATIAKHSSRGYHVSVYGEDKDHAGACVSFSSAGGISFDALAELADVLGTRCINFEYEEGCSYSEWTADPTRCDIVIGKIPLSRFEG